MFIPKLVCNTKLWYIRWRITRAIGCACCCGIILCRPAKRCWNRTWNTGPSQTTKGASALLVCPRLQHDTGRCCCAGHTLLGRRVSDMQRDGSGARSPCPHWPNRTVPVLGVASAQTWFSRRRHRLGRTIWAKARSVSLVDLS